jgi:hypothetical protein
MLPKIITYLKLMPAYAETYLLQNITSSRKKRKMSTQEHTKADRNGILRIWGLSGETGYLSFNID